MTIPKIAAYELPRRDELPRNKVQWRLQPERAVLLVHDMQRYFLSFYGDRSPLAEALIANTRALVATCRERGMKIVYTAQPTGQSSQDRALLNDMWGRGIDQAPELQPITAELAPEPEDVVLTKWRYSAFIRTDLQERLAAWDRDQLVICGIYANIGCMMTAAHAYQLDVRPFLVADAVADFSREEHDAALRYIATRCGLVTDCEAIRCT